MPKDVALDEPVHILYVTDAQAANASTHPRTLLVAERGASVTLVESFAAVGTISGNCAPVFAEGPEWDSIPGRTEGDPVWYYYLSGDANDASAYYQSVW